MKQNLFLIYLALFLMVIPSITESSELLIENVYMYSDFCKIFDNSGWIYAYGKMDYALFKSNVKWITYKPDSSPKISTENVLEESAGPIICLPFENRNIIASILSVPTGGTKIYLKDVLRASGVTQFADRDYLQIRKKTTLNSMELKILDPSDSKLIALIQEKDQSEFLFVYSIDLTSSVTTLTEIPNLDLISKRPINSDIMYIGNDYWILIYNICDYYKCEIYAKLFPKSANSWTVKITSNMGFDTYPKITKLSNNDFVVVFHRYNSIYSTHSIYGRKFSIDFSNYSAPPLMSEEFVIKDPSPIKNAFNKPLIVNINQVTNLLNIVYVQTNNRDDIFMIDINLNNGTKDYTILSIKDDQMHVKSSILNDGRYAISYYMYYGMTFSGLIDVSTKNCNLGYYYDSAGVPGSKCLPCHNSCKSCSGPLGTNCLSCQNGKILSGGTCLLEDCISGCKTCNDTTTCSTCLDSNFLNAGTCNDCNSTCKTCMDGTGECSSCNDDKYLAFNQSSSLTCKSCPIACATCINDFSCLSCNDNFSFNGFNCNPINIDNCKRGLTVNGIQKCTLCNSGFYLDSKETCKPCNSSTGRKFDINGTCVCENDIGYYSYGTNNCIKPCPNKFYFELSSHLCKKCQSNCDICFNNSKCQTCSSGFKTLEDKTACVTQCPKFYYEDSNLCKRCEENCETCDSNGCSSCVNGFFLYSAAPKGSQCKGVDGCPDYFYGDYLTNTCKDCRTNSPNCIQCERDGRSCKKCDAGYKLLNRKCFDNCPYRHFSTTTASGEDICIKCADTNCKVCSSLNTCTQCEINYFLKNGDCELTCGDEYYKDTSLSNNFQCGNCLANCKFCYNSNSCVTCNTNTLQYTLPTAKCEQSASCDNGFFINGDQCIKCRPNCTSCTSSTTCTSCESGYKLFNQQCYLSSCPQGSYQDMDPSNVSNCLECPDGCSACENTVICTACKSDYFMGESYLCEPNSECGIGSYILEGVPNTCTSCDAKCSKCTKSSTNCQGCNTGFFLYESSCVQTCPDGFVGVTSTELSSLTTPTCKECGTNCKQCSATNTNSCTECFNGYLLFDNQCVETCPDYNYIDSDYNCIPCSGDWCPGVGNSCPAKKYKNFIKKECSDCKTECATCASKDVCLTCESNFYLSKNSCITDCPNGTYKGAGVCTDCPKGCSNCISATSCSSCLSDYYYFNDTCYAPCYDIGYYLDTATDYTCKPCMADCKKCMVSNTCDECNATNAGGEDLFLKADKSSCVTSCPTGFYSDTTSRSCRPCKEGCATCDNGTNCLTCSSLFLDPTKASSEYNCVAAADCPPQYYANSTNNKCTRCTDTNCQVCDTSGICSKCVDNYFLKTDKTCTTDCGDGFLNDTSDFSCKSCDITGTPTFNCKKCYVPGKCSECTGSLILHLNYQCLSTCPDGFYSSTDSNNKNICAICESPCQNCTASGTSSCTSCIPDKYLDGNTCVDTCVSPKFNNSNNYECSTCGVSLVNYGNSCLATCPNGYYADISNVCQPCNITDCEQCSLTGGTVVCNTCKFSYYLTPTNTCVSSCSSGLYPSTDANGKNICNTCKTACSECSSDTVCTSCNSGNLFYSNDCIDPCPNFAYLDANKMCQKCSSVCASGTKCTYNTATSTASCQ